MNTTPKRTSAVTDLMRNIALSRLNMDTIKGDPLETNCALGFCEVAVSLPPAWFTDLEKTIILSVVCELYGDARKFLADLNDESVSFYRRASEAVGHGETCDKIVAIIHELHEKEFGVTK